MKDRCFNEKDKQFSDYGARGITVCEEWRNSFEQFYADMGPRPAGLTIERKNNDIGYSKDNCVWATHMEQNRNKRAVVMSMELALNVRTVKTQGGNIAEWARERGIKEDTARIAARGHTWKELPTEKEK